MVQVCDSSCLGGARADSLVFQLAVAFRLVSSRSVRRSLRRPSYTLPHHIRLVFERFRRSNRPRRIPTRLPRPNGLLALRLDVAPSFRRRACFRRYQGLSHRIRRVPERFRRIRFPGRHPVRPARLLGLLGRKLDVAPSFRRRARPRRSWGTSHRIRRRW